jgi:hypothetical protein
MRRMEVTPPPIHDNVTCIVTRNVTFTKGQGQGQGQREGQRE